MRNGLVGDLMIEEDDEHGIAQLCHLSSTAAGEIKADARFGFSK